MSDHFRAKENAYIKSGSFKAASPSWITFRDHAIITHQDDMTKVDLPYFVKSASADVTRWRFGANAHVSAINGDAVVSSHEQGMGAKNAGCTAEEIVLDHIVRCRGESIMVVVSDNAAVEKNWLCTIALPQYIVDQGLADIVLIVFLENNHGKWLADLLFGQLQTKRRRDTLLSVDHLLNEFESINRKRGKVRGFALNPLSSIKFYEVLRGLGYETKPPKDFGFTKKNVHFAGPCRLGAKKELYEELKTLLGNALPDEPGMVRICTNPPTDTPQNELPYEERYFDKPACTLSQPPENTATDVSRDQSVNRNDQQSITGVELDDTQQAPLAVPLDKAFSVSGNGVVSHRTADHVDFNEYNFRHSTAIPELKDVGSELVRRAWTSGLRAREETEEGFVEKVEATESRKCAPKNWVMRRPVHHMDCPKTGPKARYPPRNLLNAKFNKVPRDANPWITCSTYAELPFPIIKGKAAGEALEKLAEAHHDLRRSVHVLHALRAVFKDMGRNKEECDVWLQKRATRPRPMIVEKYFRELKLFVEREKEHPSASLIVKQAFKMDPEVRVDVDRVLLERGITNRDGKHLSKIINELFEKAEITPGGINTYEYVFQKDMERVTRDLKAFKEKRRKFDEDHGLLLTQVLQESY